MPNSVAVGLGFAWVTNNSSNRLAVMRIDPASNAVAPIDVAPAFAVNPNDIAIGEDAIWVLIGDTMYRVDPETNEVTGRLRDLAPGSLLSGIATGEGAVWVTDATRGTVIRIDPATNDAVETIPVGIPADGVAVGEGAVWVTNSVDETVTRIDPETNRVVKTIRVPGAARWIAVGAGRVWITDPAGDSLAVLDPASNRVHSIPVGDGPTGLAANTEAIWVVNSRDGTVSRIDPRTDEVIETIVVGNRPYGIAAEETDVWVTLLLEVSEGH